MSTNQRSEFAVGMSAFAGVMLIIVGISHFLAGLAGVLKHGNTVYTTTANKTYYLHLNTAGWGWIHMLLGIVIFLAGLGIFAGQVWARSVGVLVAALSLGGEVELAAAGESAAGVHVLAVDGDGVRIRRSDGSEATLRLE